MSPLRSFSAGIITTLLVMGSLAYWYLPHLRVLPDAPMTKGVGGVALSGSTSSPASDGSGLVYVAEPFATPLSTDCSIYDPRQQA
jgi:hypothetical protein